MGQYPEHLLEVIAAEMDYDLYREEEESNMKLEDFIKIEMELIIGLAKNVNDKNRDKVIDKIRNSKGRIIARIIAEEAINNNKR